MCGNAARCAIKFLQTYHPSSEEIISLETEIGIIKGKVLPDGLVELTLLPEAISFQYEHKVLKVDELAIDAMCITTGVPHAVIEVKDIETYPIDRVGAALVGHSAFGEAGTNVTFFERVMGNRIKATTFERGVERETLACGTGAAAAAILYTELYLQHFPVEVVLPGGELEVSLSSVAKKLLIKGPAEMVAEITLTNLPRNFRPPEPYGRRKKKS
jgi:diaminopimelate epimerase